ncbi:MAG: AAA family ATPase [Candidatus Magasanikbacteria bacterium]
MDFSETEKLPLQRQDGQVYFQEGKNAWYFGQKLDHNEIQYRRYKGLVDKLQIGLLTLFALFCFVLFYLFLPESSLLFSFKFWLNPDPLLAWFWLGVLSILYVWARVLILNHKDLKVFDYQEKDFKQKNPSGSDLSKSGAENLSKKSNKDLTKYFTKDCRKIIDRAYRLADKNNIKEVSPEVIFYSLLFNERISSIFVRLNLPVDQIKEKFSEIISGSTQLEPKLKDGFYQTIFLAYKIARKEKQEHIDVTELILATVQNSNQLQEFLYDLKVDMEKLQKVVEWVRIRSRLRKRYRRRQKEAAYRSEAGIDRAMTSVATPYLNKFSQDLTFLAQKSQLESCVARKKEIDEIFRVIETGRQSVLLTGEIGVGKSTLVNGIAQRMIGKNIPKELEEKRLVKLSISKLLAGTSVSGAQQRLINIMQEVAKAGNVVLFIDGIDKLMGAQTDKGSSLDVAGTLAEYLSSGRFLTIAVTTNKGYNRQIVNTQLDTIFSRVNIEEMDLDQTIKVLESKAGLIEHQQNIFFSYKGLEQSAELAEKFIQQKNLPESAIEIMTQAASYSRSQKGEKSLVLEEDVSEVVSDKTGIPTTSLTEEESEKLMKLEEKMHERIIGQDEAVEMVSNALRRARTEVRSEDKPISTFLFLGPTGVGKTELAKTISSTYFGGEEKMIRIDMSEYQDKQSVYRLIGQPNEQGTGLLTQQVRENPFSLLLLDELEKSSQDVQNLFLQAFDDGKLTDSVGREVDFTNTIIIATSNAGTEYVQKELEKGKELEDIKEKLIRGKLQEYYPPEFLNRFDGIVLFKSLKKEEVKQIADLMLERVREDMEDKGIKLEITEGALESLVEEGYDPQFGARPMQRAIQDNIENKLAELVLEDDLDRRDEVTIKKDFEVDVKRK